ncbi:MAG: hemin uptake protein HemP [Roseinatronobacter sp.]
MSHVPSATSFRTPQPMPPVHDAYDLTQGGILAKIVLETQTYQLRITRAGKLILTK